jgi:hypothetical protein
MAHKQVLFRSAAARRSYVVQRCFATRCARRLRCKRRLEVVPAATHLFEEPGTLESVVALTRTWFLTHLPVHMAEAVDNVHRSEAGQRLAERLLV